MSGFDGYSHEEGDEMWRRERDRQIEELLGGEPSGDAGLDALAPLVASLGEPDQIDDDIATSHIAAASAAAASGAAAPSPASDPGPASSWRRLFRRGAISGLTAKIVLGTAIAAAAVGGAVTGALPRPVQTFFADTVSRVGLELPDARLAPYTTTSTTSTTPTTTTTTASVAVSEPTTTSSSTSTTTTEPGDDASGTVAPGSYAWEGTACNGDAISIAYRVVDGRLVLGSITGDVAESSVRSDRIRVRFDDDIRVEIRIEDEGLDTDEQRECDGASDDVTTSTSEPDDDSHEGTTTTTSPDDDSHDSSGSGSGGEPDEETTSTTTPDDEPDDKPDEEPSS